MIIRKPDLGILRETVGRVADALGNITPKEKALALMLSEKAKAEGTYSDTEVLAFVKAFHDDIVWICPCEAWTFSKHEPVERDP